MSFWINGHPMQYTFFPNNERMPDGKFLTDMVGTTADVTIRWSYLSDQDFIMLLFMVEHLKHGIGATNDRAIRLDVDYFPYSRMDRSPTTRTDVFTLKYVTQFINELGFDLVRVVEPHSDVLMALLNNAEAVSPMRYLTESYRDAVFAMVLPDAGAEKRYGSLDLGPACVGQKKRDFATGEITKINILGMQQRTAITFPAERNRPIVIVDDLCSRGGTFVGIIQAIRDLGYNHPIDLVVAHLENTVFQGDLLPLVRRIVTTDSMHTVPHSQITAIPLTNIFEGWGR